MKNIKFVSYSGEYPALCAGTLVVEIDGKIVTFGWSDPCNQIYPRFWQSGGSVSFDDEWNECVDCLCDWELSVSEYNKKDYPPEIFEILPNVLEVMNENVPGGCCGGCV